MGDCSAVEEKNEQYDKQYDISLCDLGQARDKNS